MSKTGCPGKPQVAAAEPTAAAAPQFALNSIQTRPKSVLPMAPSSQHQQQQSIRPPSANQMKSPSSVSVHQQVPMNLAPPSSSTISASSKQQMSARARAITAKLESSGAELRRTLFSLRQIFQDEPRLSAEFVETANGLESLLKVAARSESDQIHQNYILRAIGQLIAHPAAMNAMARHSETVSWLYSLLGSQHRLVAKTALSLLLAFVEANDNNCLHLCRAIKTMDSSKGDKTWSKLTQIFIHNGVQQDLSLVVEAMTLVNKTLARVPDQANFFEFAQPLEELVDIGALARKLSPLSGSDAQVKEQFELFERTVKAGARGASKDGLAENGCGETRNEASSEQMSFDESGRNYQSGGKQLNNTQGNKQQSAGLVEVETKHKVNDNYLSASESAGSPDMSRLEVNEGPSKAELVISGADNKSKHQTTMQQVGSQLPPLDSMRNNNTGSMKVQKNNLARGKQQRASISSCSSSDSYASYGSGYASGSGNSTDHELKLQIPHHQQQPTSDTLSPTSSNQTASNQQAGASLKVSSTVTLECKLSERLSAGLPGRDQEAPRSRLAVDNSEEEEEGEEGEEDNESQLKKHLNELAQLTDDLANTTTSLSLSTGSNISSLSPSHNNPKNPDASSGESRSTTATPTLNPKQMEPSKPIHQQSQSSKSGGLAAVQSTPANQPTDGTKLEPYYHNLFQWEQLVGKGVTRPLFINDLDFTDLRDEDDCDLLNTQPSSSDQRLNGAPLTIRIPKHSSSGELLESSEDSGQGTGDSIEQEKDGSLGPPPPMPPPLTSPWFNTFSRPQSQLMSSPSPIQPSLNEAPHNYLRRNQSPAGSTYSNYSRNSTYVTPSNTSGPGQYNTLQPASSLRSASSMSSLLFGGANNRFMNKRKKTMKLFWKEVREDRSLLAKLTKKRTIWDEIKPVEVDTQKLENLFESKAKDLVGLSKSRMGLDGLGQRRAKISVLDAKRSNAINIGMTKLPPMRTIKSAILKMDSSIMNREGIEKILTTMMPSEEEKSRIIEAQLANPDTPLGTAEQFLLNLASISALEARLKLWAFQLDYAQIEKEVAEPLMDLKQAIDEIERSETFRLVLGTLLAIGNFLNSTNAKGFQIDYLEKVPEVKDTVHKHSLLHHLCLFIQEKYGAEETSDLYSEFGAVNRASKVDYSEVAKNLKKMQQDCKASWDHLRIVAKHDGLANLMNSCNANNSSSSTSSASENSSNNNSQMPPKSSGKLNNLSKLSMITTVIGVCENSGSSTNGEPTKQLKTKVSDFLTDCAERIMVLIVIHRRVMNRFQKLLVYLGCPTHQIKQTQPQQILKIINEFALEYRTKRERVREMLMKQQQCQHRQHLSSNRWQLNRNRWAGSQQSLSQDGYRNHNSRPCSTASSYVNPGCMDSMCNMQSLESRNRLNNNNSNRPNCDHYHNHLRASSPSALSQVSTYDADYQGCFENSCCSSRQQSVTPTPMSTSSMFDLHQNRRYSVADTTSKSSQLEDDEDEKLKQLLGPRKSLENACEDLYQMSHFNSTLARTTRHPPPSLGHSGKQHRAMGIDLSSEDAQAKRQSSYYRYLHGVSMDDQSEHNNSDDEILQSLLRTVTAKSTHNVIVESHEDGQRNGSRRGSTDKSARNKILSRLSCDRKSLRRSPRSGVEVPNVG